MKVKTFGTYIGAYALYCGITGEDYGTFDTISEAEDMARQLLQRDAQLILYIYEIKGYVFRSNKIISKRVKVQK